jgi:murein DD-endopeptidase MepM/ murein hydrolase activator NlpD
LAAQAEAPQEIWAAADGSSPAQDPIPPAGDCRRIGWTYIHNPFSGWPIEERVCDRSVVVWEYCSDRYPTEYPHWGIDLAYRGIEGVNVVSTTDKAIVGRLHREGRWNGGMGNYVELRAIECWKEKSHFTCSGGFCIDSPLPESEYEPGANPALEPVERAEVCVETGWIGTYMHLMEVTVSVGQRVDRGDVIGRVGNVGNVSGFHLHYEITSPFDKPGGAIDPLPTLCDWDEQ